MNDHDQRQVGSNCHDKTRANDHPPTGWRAGDNNKNNKNKDKGKDKVKVGWVLKISLETIEEIKNEAARAYPYECCGALIGVLDGDVRDVKEILPIGNERKGEAQRRRFLITAEELAKVEIKIAKKGLDILGFYHSHPDHPSRPSKYDEDFALPFYSYAIISVEKGKPTELTSWVLDENRIFISEELRS
ncbi:MAG: M67 family metallopeptidase [Elusimicrobiota bacterium]|nr:M67 family metallopeptidase [Elusimicrobiota bacterium]